MHYHCDKLECDIQMKLYDQEGCFDLNNQPNNPILNNPSVRKVLDSEKIYLMLGLSLIEVNLKMIQTLF